MADIPSPFWAGFLGHGVPHNPAPTANPAAPVATVDGPANGPQQHAPLARTFSGTFAPHGDQALAPRTATNPRSLFGDRATVPRLNNPRTNATTAVMADQLLNVAATSGTQLAPHQAMAQAMGTAAAMVAAAGDGTAAAHVATAALDTANQMANGAAAGHMAGPFDANALAPRGGDNSLADLMAQFNDLNAAHPTTEQQRLQILRNIRDHLDILTGNPRNDPRSPTPSHTTANPVPSSSYSSKDTKPLLLTRRCVQGYMTRGLQQALTDHLRDILAYEKRRPSTYPSAIVHHVEDDDLREHLRAHADAYRLLINGEILQYGPDPSAWRLPDLRDPVPIGGRVELNAHENRMVKDTVRYVFGEVRPASVQALDDLHEGQVRQGKDEPVARYAQRFMVKARMVPNESQQSLCRLYLAGLKNGLKEQCLLDRDNNRWTSLHDLIQFSFGEEERYNLRTSVSNPRHTSNGTRLSKQDFYSVDGKSWPGGRPADRKRNRDGVAAVAVMGDPMDSDTAPDALAAVAASNTPRKAQATGDGRRKWSPQAGSGGGRGGRHQGASGASNVYLPDILTFGDSEVNRTAGIAGKPRKPPIIGRWRQTPMEACPVYVAPGELPPPLDDKTRDLLLEWGICKRCRCSREHKAEQCPKK